MSGLYAEDALYLAPGEAPRRGRSAILPVFEKFFAGVRRDGATLALEFRILVGAMLGLKLAHEHNLRLTARLRQAHSKFIVAAIFNVAVVAKVNKHYVVFWDWALFEVRRRSRNRGLRRSSLGWPSQCQLSPPLA